MDGTGGRHVVRRQGGFTLVELMVAMTLAMLFVGGMIQIMSSNRENVQMQNALVDMNQNARSAMEFITRELKNAIYVSSVTATSVTFHVDSADAVIGVASAGDATTLTDDSRSWTTNAHAGKTLVVTGVAGNQQVRTISGNGATVLTVPAWDAGMTPTPGASVYHIGAQLRAFSYSGDTILYTRGALVDEVLTDSITNLQFTVLTEGGGRQRVEVLLATEAARADSIDGNKPTFSLRNSVKLRN